MVDVSFFGQARSGGRELSGLLGCSFIEIGPGDKPEEMLADVGEQRVFFIDRPYRDMAPESLDELKQMYRVDMQVNRYLREHPNVVRLNSKYLSDQLDVLEEACGTLPDLGQLLLPTGPLCEEVEREIALMEDRKLLQIGTPYLSHDAVKAIELGTPDPCLPTDMDDLKEYRSQWMWICDLLLEEEALKGFISYEPSGKGYSSLIVIFSHFAVIRPYLRNPFFLKYLANRQIKLWHLDEWKMRYIEQFQQSLRSNLLVSGVVLPSPRQEVIEEFAAVAKHTLGKIGDLVYQKHTEVSAYYASEAFRERLAQIQQGAPIRVLVEQVCSSVFVKQFSRAVSRDLTDLGHEVIMHPNCPPDHCDNHMANAIDTAHFQPNLLIRSPNSYNRASYQDVPGLPTIIPLQDHEPHMGFAGYVRENPLGPHSMVLLIEDRFYEGIREAGVPEDQVFFDFLPVDEPPTDVDQYEQMDLYDIGFVKTMTHDLDLPAITAALGHQQLDESSIEALSRVQKLIEDRVQRLGFVDFLECQQWAPNSLWLNGCVAFAHERLCEHFISALAKKGYRMGLTGNNWQKFPHLADYGLGYARSREIYYQRFFDNKINLSINPWDIYHPRILEGGWCGGFFLIHRMPDDVAWQHLPAEMEPGVHFDYFHDRAELLEKVAYYLEHEELRRKIGRNLKTLVREQFTYPAYSQLLIDRFRHLIDKWGTDPFANRVSVSGESV